MKTEPGKATYALLEQPDMLVTEISGVLYPLRWVTPNDMREMRERLMTNGILEFCGYPAFASHEKGFVTLFPTPSGVFVVKKVADA